MDSGNTPADRVRGLVEEYGRRSGLDPQEEDAYTLVGGLITELLQLVAIEGADWREVVNRGIWHFRTATVYPGGAGEDEDLQDWHIRRCALARELGISYQEAARRLSTADAERLVNALESHTLSTAETFVPPDSKLAALVPPGRP